MKLTELDQDILTGRSLAVDNSDPARYYLLDRRRRDLLAIGDADLARRRFAARIESLSGATSRRAAAR